MADLDPNPALRDEINKALDIIEPQIRGLEDLYKVPASQEVIALIGEQLDRHRQRFTLLNAVLTGLNTVVTARDDLDADGYPSIPTVTIDPDILNQLKGEVSDIDSAFALFSDSNRASGLSIQLGNPTDKPRGAK